MKTKQETALWLTRFFPASGDKKVVAVVVEDNISEIRHFKVSGWAIRWTDKRLAEMPEGSIGVIQAGNKREWRDRFGNFMVLESEKQAIKILPYTKRIVCK